MAPKIKVTKEEIIKTALSITQKNGASALNARTVAGELGCSTQPIFSNFANMEELNTVVISAAYESYLGFINNEVESGKYPQYKAFGMAYIRFAKEERELFKLLFMRDRTGEDLTPSPDFEASASIISSAFGVTVELAMLIHLEIWSSVHGIAVMIASSFLTLEWDLISEMLSDIYHGIRARYTGKLEAKK